MLATSEIKQERSRPIAKGSRRTCVSCRDEKTSAELLHVVVDPDGGLVADWKRNLPGRGAHVCVRTECITKAFERRLFNKALRGEVVYGSVDEFISMACASLYRQLETLLRSGMGAKRIVVGNDEALGAIYRRGARAILVAADSGRRRKFSALAEENDIDVRVFSTKDAFGTILGRKPTGVLVVIDDGLAVSSLRVVDHMLMLDGKSSGHSEDLFGEDGAESQDQLVQ